MRYARLSGLFVLAVLGMALAAEPADAAVFHRRSTAVRTNPGFGRGGGFHRTSTTAVRPTPARPAAGPVITHRSRTAVFRR